MLFRIVPLRYSGSGSPAGILRIVADTVFIRPPDCSLPLQARLSLNPNPDPSRSPSPAPCRLLKTQITSAKKDRTCAPRTESYRRLAGRRGALYTIRRRTSSSPFAIVLYSRNASEPSYGRGKIVVHPGSQCTHGRSTDALERYYFSASRLATVAQAAPLPALRASARRGPLGRTHPPYSLFGPPGSCPECCRRSRGRSRSRDELPRSTWPTTGRGRSNGGRLAGRLHLRHRRR